MDIKRRITYQIIRYFTRRRRRSRVKDQRLSGLTAAKTLLVGSTRFEVELNEAEVVRAFSGGQNLKHPLKVVLALSRDNPKLHCKNEYVVFVSIPKQAFWVLSIKQITRILAKDLAHELGHVVQKERGAEPDVLSFLQRVFTMFEMPFLVLGLAAGFFLYRLDVVSALIFGLNTYLFAVSASFVCYWYCDEERDARRYSQEHYREYLPFVNISKKKNP